MAPQGYNKQYSYSPLCRMKFLLQKEEPTFLGLRSQLTWNVHIMSYRIHRSSIWKLGSIDWIREAEGFHWSYCITGKTRRRLCTVSFVRQPPNNRHFTYLIRKVVACSRAVTRDTQSGTLNKCRTWSLSSQANWPLDTGSNICPGFNFISNDVIILLALWKDLEHLHDGVIQHSPH